MFKKYSVCFRFELLEVLSFDSVRRRMSVIVKSSTGRGVTFCCFLEVFVSLEFMADIEELSINHSFCACLYKKGDWVPVCVQMFLKSWKKSFWRLFFLKKDIFGRFEFHVLSLLGDIFLFCKGADSSIFPRVKEGKIEQIRSRVERNAVVRFRFIDLFMGYHCQKELIVLTSCLVC